MNCRYKICGKMTYTVTPAPLIQFILEKNVIAGYI